MPLVDDELTVDVEAHAVVGRVPEEHYGHKNVIFRDLADDALPRRPISSQGLAANAMTLPIRAWWVPFVPLMELGDHERYMDLTVFFRENRGLEACPTGVDTRELPADCRETATTPAELFEKLDQWGFPALVIPHGTTWGFYTPPGYTWDKQLDPDMDSPRQRLVEVYSGHGNSEEYRTALDVVREPDGTYSCPAPSDDYEPCCHRAGELIRARCAAEGASAPVLRNALLGTRAGRMERVEDGRPTALVLSLAKVADAPRGLARACRLAPGR